MRSWPIASGIRPRARLGRITLNPLPHIDPLGALAFILAGFGWPSRCRSRRGISGIRFATMAFVAAAGPLSNFAAAFVALVALRLLVRVGARSRSC